MNRILQFLKLFLSPLERGRAAGVCSRRDKSLFPIRTNLSKVPFLLLFTLYSILATAQNFPVQVIPQALPPAPIYVSNYADASTVTSPLRVQIILNDFEIANREIRLKTYFTGSGLSFESNDIVVGASPLFLEGGIPLILTNVELAPYFEFNNITGINANQYGSAIPEGAYQFCVEVYDVLTGSRLSNKSCAVSVVFQNEPPFLVLPRNKTNVDEVNPQYIVFQWTPRSINVSNVEYELSLVEIWDTQVDPQQAFLSSPPVFQTTTTSPTYVYGPSDPQLLSGKNYAWRVQAKAKQGTEEIGLFKNQGFSEIYSFSYASACELPLAINHEVKGSTNANIFWDDFSTEIPEYTVRYRQKNSASSENEWFFSKTTTNQLTLWDLKAGGTYEYQLQNKCAVAESQWSTIKQFTTFIADDEDSVYECGIQPDFSLTNQDPLQTIGDKFTAGDFPIKVLEATGSNGRFTGKGYVTIPYLSSIRVGVEFTNVLINTDNQLLEGSVITIYDPSLKNILDIDEVIDTIDDITDTVGELFEGDNDLDEMRVNFSIPKDKVEEIIKVVDGNVVITNPTNGESISEPLGDDKVVVDKDGQVYHIDAGGNITEGGQIDPGGSVNSGNVDGVTNNGKITELTAKGIQITFEDTNGIYGFDEIPNTDNSKINKEYTIIPDADGKDYVLVHQAVEKGRTATITAVVNQSSGTYELSEIVFKTKTGEVIPSQVSGNEITLTVKGNYTFENETIYAVVPSKEDSSKQLTAGAFTLWHLTDRAIDVVLVSVDGATIPNGTETTVFNIFKKGAATVNITRKTASLDAALLGADNKLEIADSPWLVAYNDEQKAVISNLKSQIDYSTNKYYLFVFKNDFATSKSIAGFMPLQRQFGFLFNGGLGSGDESKGDLGIVAAHEIGHGVFALQHPFTQYGSAKESTDWLMDYKNNKVLLSHMDWAQMHDPALKFYVFQDEEDGEIANKIWYTPNWEPFTVENTSTITSVKIDNVPLGTIPGFKLNGKLYHAEFEADKFLGYFANYKKEDAAHDEYIPAKISSLDSNASVYLFQYNGGCGYNRYYETKFFYANANKTSIAYGSDTNIEFVGTIPCTQSGTENKNPFQASICELIGQDDVANSTGIEKAVEKLNLALAKREAITDTNTPRNKGEFFHLVNVSANALDGRAEVIEDKLYLLKQKTGVNFFVVFQPVDTKMNEVARDDFAQQVINQSNLGNTGSKNVLITVPYFTLNPLASFSAINCIQPGFAQNDNSIVRNQSFGFKQADNLLEYVLGAFADIEKPLFIRRYFLKANGTLVNQEIETKSGKLKRGYPYLNEVEFYESPSLPAIKNLQSRIARTSPESNSDFDIPVFLEIRDGWILELNNLFITAEENEIKSFKENNLRFWGDKKDIEIGGFREFYIKNIDLTNTYVSTKINGTYLESWKIIFGKSNLEPKHLNDFDLWTVVDQTVYASLDVVSLIPVADTFADFGGLLYAGVRGDIQNTAIYAGSLAIPFAGAGYLKGLKNGIEYADEAYAITAKKVNGTVEFDVKKISELDSDELQVSTILTNDPDIAKKIGDEDIKNYVDEDGIAKLLDDAANGGSNIIGVTKESFKLSFEAADEIAEEAWGLFKEKKWSELELLFRNNNLNKWNDIIYPPNNGFIDITNTTIPVGDTFDRFGGWYDKSALKFRDKGKFVAPDNVPFPQRALPEDALNSPRQTYEVLKPIPEVKEGKAIPWFGQPGNGTQYQLPKSIDELIEGGFIRRIDNTLLENGTGKFIDDAIETNYQNYLIRKAREGKKPRERLDWKEASDYMKYDSPTARGNAFNKKGELEYEINELNLVREDGSFVRIDSYVPANSSPTGEGMIISRKATDLIDIEESTFRAHLQELNDKYSPGTEIRSNAYPILNGDTIEGKQYLEIPESNKQFYDIERYKQIAKDEFNVEIIFLAE